MRGRAWLCEWALVLLLCSPAALFYAAHFAVSTPENVLPTGFVQYDGPYYMANARQYLDGVNSGPFYPLPFSADPHAAAIHFQPQTALLALAWKITGLAPGIVFVLFGAVFGALFLFVALRVLRTIVQEPGLLMLVFAWGGGVLFFTGFIYGLLYGESFDVTMARAFRFDPANGYWFLNLGRNLIYPLEAYYHFLFFSAALMVMNERWKMAVVFAVVLGLSHPFTGVGVLGVLLAWSFLERFVVRSRIVPMWFFLAILSALLLLLAWHGLWLPRDREHAMLMQQWKIAWLLPLTSWLPAYLPVALPALWRFRTKQRAIEAFRAPHVRLLIAWVLVWSALEHHELFMPAVQPLHFTRGYVWAGLFLLGAPVMRNVLIKLRTKVPRAVGYAVVALLVALSLCDNAVWMTQQALENHRAEGEAIVMTMDEKEVLDHLAKFVAPGPLLVANDPMVAYLALMYTPHRAFYSHRSNTPYSDRRYGSLLAYFEGRGVTDPLLEQELLVIAYERGGPFVHAAQGQKLFANASYAIYRMPAQGGSP